jgi:hypothetical protein
MLINCGRGGFTLLTIALALEEFDLFSSIRKSASIQKGSSKNLKDEDPSTQKIL